LLPHRRQAPGVRENRHEKPRIRPGRSVSVTGTGRRSAKGRAKLLDLAEAEEKMAKEVGTKLKIEWGNQIRSYVLAPYRMVKDHRTRPAASGRLRLAASG
jgi:hypothetical protein